MSKAQDKKRKLFNVFSQNLMWLGEHPIITSNQDITNKCMCPICMKLYSESDLSPIVENHLTLEHVPPESLGGKGQLLTCKKCNSISGSQLDSHLLNLLHEQDFQEFLPNSATRTTFELNGNKVNGNVKIDERGGFIIDLQPKISDPKQDEQFMKDLILPRSYYSPFLNWDKFIEPQPLTPTFKFDFRAKADKRRAEVALLRIAYLYACAAFGHSFYINPDLNEVRNQIRNPDKEIIKAPYWIHMDVPLGINIIKQPKELQCFIIAFELKTKSKTRRFSVALPGYTDPGRNIYQNINTIVGVKECSIIVDYIERKPWLEKKEDVVASMEYWNGITNPTDKS